MVEISEKILVSFKNGPECTIPSSLLVKAETGQKFLKLRPSAPILVKLICGPEHAEELAKVKNPSLATSPKFQELRGMIEEAVRKHADGKQDAEHDLFGDVEPDTVTKQGKPSLQDAPETISLDLNGVTITCLTPTSWKSSDISVALEESQLEAVFSHLEEDCPECFENRKKRRYEKSGFFRKAKGE